MLTFNTTNLRRVLEIQEKIESLQREINNLVNKDASLAAFVGGVSADVAPRRRGRKPGRKPGRPAKKAAPSGRKPGRPPKAAKVAKAEEAAKPAKTDGRNRTSPFKGKKRPSSPSGPLGPAVAKVLSRAGGALTVDAILEGLKKDKYVWNVANPKGNLSARLYTLKGVKKTSPGKFGIKK